MSLVQDLALSTLNTVVASLSLHELGSEAAPYRSLRSPMSPAPVGQARVFTGGDGEQLIYIGLTVPMIHLDSHMVFCFTAPSSPVPHFTLDAVHAGEHFAFHLDLLPRVDLAVNLAYMRHVYEPLTPVFSAAKTIAGLSPAHLSPVQLAVMSPWMLAHRATEAAMDAACGTSSQYLQHWLSLRNNPPPTSGQSQNLAQRDLAHRAVLFSREVDPVWSQVERLLGFEASEELRLLLSGGTPL